MSSSKRPERWKYDRIVPSSVNEDEDDKNVLELSTITKREADVDAAGTSDFDQATRHRRLPSNDMDNQSFYADDSPGFEHDEPSPQEVKSLRRVSDKIPWSAFLVAIVELCERFSYYGLSGPFQNYISNSYKNGANPGALGLGQQGATALTNFFQFWCYLTPVIGAIVADQYLGRYKTIVLFAFFYLIGLVILFVTSLPVSIENGAALPGLVTAMIVIGLGTGGIKSNVSPLIAEQYQETRLRIKILSSGEKVIVDPTLTISRLYMIFYLCINVGSLSGLATTTMELYIGFWSSYLLALVMFIVGFGILIAGRRKYVLRPPKGSVLTHSFRALYIGMKSKRGLDAAKPSVLRSLHQDHGMPWDDLFVDELKRALVACKVFLIFPIYWMTFNQMMNNFVSQAGTMELHGIPSDIMQNIDPFALILLIPLCDRILYPYLRRIGIQFKPITRIFWGFLFGSMAMLYAAFVQRQIYRAGPCYENPLHCPEARLPNGQIQHNQVHVALQAPSYLLIAISEILAAVTGLEYAYTKAPTTMKSFIMSVYLLTTAFGAALGAAIAPFAKDPNLVWLYLWLGGASFSAGCVFWLLFRHYNRVEDAMNDLGSQGPEKEVPREGPPSLPMPYRLSKLDLGGITPERSRSRMQIESQVPISE